MRLASLLCLGLVLGAPAPAMAQQTDDGSRHEIVPSGVLIPSGRPLLDAQFTARSRDSREIVASPNGAMPSHAVFDPHDRARLGVAVSDPGSPGLTRGPATGRATVSEPQRFTDPWWAPLASAVLPGAGQARLEQDRFVGYLAVEGFLWLRYVTDRREGLRQRDAYRDVALRVSRASYPGDKPAGNFEYYERMEHWIASGAYDADPSTPGLDPEGDTTSFNGAMWLLARRTYWTQPNAPPPVGSPAYVAALLFYQESAVRPDFQWSWRSARLEQDIYRRHIKESNDAFRHAIQDVGVVIANHVLSTVDAYISLRLRMRTQLHPNGQSSVGISTTVPLSALGGPQ